MSLNVYYAIRVQNISVSFLLINYFGIQNVKQTYDMGISLVNKKLTNLK
jgi:hypothetical protein